MRKRITDVTLKALKPARKGKRVEIFDSIIPSFGIRSTDNGIHSYFVKARFGGSPNQSRRTIARVGQVTLAEARATAKAWAEAAALKRDPAEEARKARAEHEGRVTFGATMEIYLKRHVAKHRTAKDTEREIRTELMSRWSDWALEDVTKKDVVKMMEDIAGRGAQRQSHNIFGLCRTFFNWCLETDRVQASPCAGIKPRRVAGELKVRTRVLDDAELTAVWQAADVMTYPFGDFVKLLLLTGARKSEASDASWSEFDLDKGAWVVPEERFKSGVTHRVPLSKDAVALLQDLPRWEGSDFVFSFDGKQPMNGHSKSKARLDAEVNKILRRECKWQVHDLRRTVRTRLAGLGVPDTVAEQIIGHGRKGLARVYDQHQYTDEMFDALERWAARLRSIVTPPPPNVLRMKRARA